MLNYLFILIHLLQFYTSRSLIFFSEEERQALVLAIAVEAGARPDIEKEVVLHVIFNHTELPPDNKAHWTITEAIGTRSLAYGVLGPNKTASIQEGYDYLSCKTYEETNPHCETYWIEHYFKPAERFVNDFINNPPPDFTQGALYFVHTSSETEAQGIASDMMACQAELPRYIAEVGITPYVNADQIHIAAVGITIYSNINILPPIRRFNSEGEKFYNC